jgi:hypothetical protein
MFLDGLRKTKKNQGQDSQCPSWDSNQAFLEYRSAALPLEQHAQL